MPQKRALTESIKKEVLADLNREASYQTDPEVVAAIKEDVLNEFKAGSSPFTHGEREFIKENVLKELAADYPYYSPRSAVDQTMVDNIKNELVAELELAQYQRPDSWRQILSQRNIDRRINEQYSDLRNLRSEIRRGLEAARQTERRLSNISDPQVRQAVQAIMQEARHEGIPLDHVISRLENDPRFQSGLGQRMGNWLSSGTAKGFLGGIGASVLISLLFPAARGSLRKIGIKMMEGTMDLADQTRSTFGRAKEGFEDMIAEANFNNLQESPQFTGEMINPSPTPENPLGDEPSL